MVPGRITGWLAFGLVMGVLPILAGAQQEDDVFWEVRQRQQAGAAAQLILERSPLTAAVLRAEGFRWKVWLEPEILSNVAPELDAEWLDQIRDGTPMPDFRGR